MAEQLASLQQGGWLDLFGTGALNPDTPTELPEPE